MLQQRGGDVAPDREGEEGEHGQCLQSVFLHRANLLFQKGVVSVTPII